MARMRAARGQRKAKPAPRAAVPEPPPSKMTDTITYIPLANGDPLKTEFAGIKFEANVPVEVARSKTVLQSIRQEMTRNDGTIVTQCVDTRVPVAEALRGNVCFSINGKPPHRRRAQLERMPTDADGYRGYALTWIAKALDTFKGHPQAMKARWDSEQSLREECGVTDSELQHILPFYDATYSQLSGGRMIESRV